MASDESENTGDLMDPEEYAKKTHLVGKFMNQLDELENLEDELDKEEPSDAGLRRLRDMTERMSELLVDEDGESSKLDLLNNLGKFWLEGRNSNDLMTNHDDSNDVVLYGRLSKGPTDQTWYWSGSMLKCTNGKVLEIDDKNSEPGAHVGAGKPHGGANQQFYFEPLNILRSKLFVRIGSVQDKEKGEEALFVSVSSPYGDNVGTFMQKKDFEDKNDFDGRDNVFEIIDKSETAKEVDKFNKWRWSRETHGTPMIDSLNEVFKFGQDGDHTVFVASSQYEKDSKFYGGRIHNGACYIAHDGREIKSTEEVMGEFYVLLISYMAKVEWVEYRDGNLVGGGEEIKHHEGVMENTVEISDWRGDKPSSGVVGRMELEGGMKVPGWVKDGTIHAPYDGKEHTSTTYELLMVTEMPIGSLIWHKTVKNGQVPPEAIVAGQDGEDPIYLCVQGLYMGYFLNGHSYIIDIDGENIPKEEDVSVFCMDPAYKVDWLDTRTGWMPEVETHRFGKFVKVEDGWWGRVELGDTTLPGIVRDGKIKTKWNKEIIGGAKYQLMIIEKD